MEKHSLMISGHRTSLSLEPLFWAELKGIAEEQGLSLAELVKEIDDKRTGNLSGAVRIYVLQYLKEKVVQNKQA